MEDEGVREVVVVLLEAAGALLEEGVVAGSRASREVRRSLL